MRFVLCCLAAVCFGCVSGTSRESEAPLLATFWPTPDTAVERMLAMADLQPGETLYDLGSGDGKIVIAAARDHGVRAVGFEINAKLVKKSRQAIAAEGLGDQAEIVQGDLLRQDLTEADVLTVFLTPEAYDWLEPKLRAEMRPGMRLVVYKFPLPGWTPAATAEFLDPDPEVPEHHVFIYRNGE